jgi:hypothetical protein
MGPVGVDGTYTYLEHVKNPADNGEKGDAGFPGNALLIIIYLYKILFKYC